MMKPSRFFCTLLTVISMLAGSGCGVVGTRYRIESPLQASEVKKISPGKTTRREVLDLFGPPAAIARRGQEIVTVPVPGIRKESSQQVQADTFFALFSAYAPNDSHVIYYYWRAEMRETHGVILGAMGTLGKLSVDKLWVLIDERTGVVVDYVFREE